jgi:peptidoglycan hydrolase CwlO-like protein
METLAQWLGMIGGAFGIIVLIIGAVVFINGSYNKARIQALREDNDDLRNRVDDLDDEAERAKIREDKLEAQVKHLSTENQLLADMITQRANVEALADLLEHHHREAMKSWKEIKDAVTEGRSHE